MQEYRIIIQLTNIAVTNCNTGYILYMETGQRDQFPTEYSE